MSVQTAVKVNLALLGAISLWSLSFVAIRVGLSGYTPGALGLLRYVAASIVLGIWFPRQKKRLNFSLSDLWLFFGVGVVGIASYSILLNTGEKTVSSGLASFVIAQTPVINAILAIAVLKERPALVTIIGILISCSGVAIMVSGQPLALEFNLGLILIFGATLCGSLHAILQKGLLTRFSPYEVTTFSTWFAAIALIFFIPELLENLEQAPLSSTAAVIFLGVFPSTLGQYLWCYGLSKTLVVRASAYLYIMPILSTLFGWILLSESPSLFALSGGLVALLGAILVKKDVPKKSLETLHHVDER